MESKVSCEALKCCGPAVLWRKMEQKEKENDQSCMDRVNLADRDRAHTVIKSWLAPSRTSQDSVMAGFMLCRRGRKSE